MRYICPVWGFFFCCMGGMAQPKAQPTEPRKGAQMNGKQAAAFAVVRVVICAATFSGLVYILILNSRTGAAVVVTRSRVRGVFPFGVYTPTGGIHSQPPVGGSAVSTPKSEKETKRTISNLISVDNHLSQCYTIIKSRQGGTLWLQIISNSM